MREVTLISDCNRSANVFWSVGRRPAGVVKRQKRAYSFRPLSEMGVGKCILSVVISGTEEGKAEDSSPSVHLNPIN